MSTRCLIHVIVVNVFVVSLFCYLSYVLKDYFDKAPSCHRSVRASHCCRAGWRISPSCSECVPVGCTQRSHRYSQHLQRLEWSLELTVGFDVSCCRWNQQHYKSLCLTLVVHCDSSTIILCRLCFLLAVRSNIPVVNLIGWGSSDICGALQQWFSYETNLWRSPIRASIRPQVAAELSYRSCNIVAYMVSGDFCFAL